MANVEKDPVSGTNTTGHEWDGIKELDTPLPKWWLTTFYACIIWAIGYWVVYPSWPTLNDYAKGVFETTNRLEHAKEMEAVKQSRMVWTTKFEGKDIEEVANDPELLNYAMAGGRVIFADNCQPCHGASGSGAKTSRFWLTMTGCGAVIWTRSRQQSCMGSVLVTKTSVFLTCRHLSKTRL